jgi:hypothetical protein
MGRLLAAIISVGDFRFILPCNMQHFEGGRLVYAAGRSIGVESVTFYMSI